MILFALFISWIASAFFCSSVAGEKGYSSSSWFIAGFFFGFFALIAVAGLPDRKLRKYILQIGMKQNAIQDDSIGNNLENLNNDSKTINGPSFGKKDTSFVTNSDVSKGTVYKKLVSEVNRCGYKLEFDKLGIKSYEIDKSSVGLLELVCRDKDDLDVLTVKGERLNEIQIIWKFTL